MKKNTKKRADILLLEQNIAQTLALAGAYIMAGNIVYYEEKTPLIAKKVDKAGSLFSSNTRFALHGQRQYVSRGGYKLETALKYFPIPVNNAICLDIGASTGGFTDCLLQYGAKKVYAIDVSPNLLHEKLHNTPKVIQVCKNIKNISNKDITDSVHLVVADISFISLEHIFTPIIPLLAENAHIITLLKPQFELPKKLLHKGIARDESTHLQAIEKICTHAQKYPLQYNGYVPSACKGRKGNQEYLLYFTKNML